MDPARSRHLINIVLRLVGTLLGKFTDTYDEETWQLEEWSARLNFARDIAVASESPSIEALYIYALESAEIRRQEIVRARGEREMEITQLQRKQDRFQILSQETTDHPPIANLQREVRSLQDMIKNYDENEERYKQYIFQYERTVEKYIKRIQNETTTQCYGPAEE